MSVRSSANLEPILYGNSVRGCLHYLGLSVSGSVINDITVLRNQQSWGLAKRIVAYPVYLAVVVPSAFETIARATNVLALLCVRGVVYFIGCFYRSDRFDRFEKSLAEFSLYVIRGTALTGAATIEALYCLKDDLYEAPIPLSRVQEVTLVFFSFFPPKPSLFLGSPRRRSFLIWIKIGF